MVPQGSGSIINTSSIAGVIGGLGGHAYTTAKTAVIGLTKSVASELGPEGRALQRDRAGHRADRA